MAQAFNYADGLRWFGEGVRALRNRPLGLVGIVVFYVLISGLLSGLPVVGTILAGVWMPFGAVLTGFAAREALADRLPGYAPLLAAFRKQGMRLHLIAVGLISAGVLELTVGAGLAAGLGGATTYITPIIAILVTTIAQACVWPMYRDLFGPKNLFERLD